MDRSGCARPSGIQRQAFNISGGSPASICPQSLILLDRVGFDSATMLRQCVQVGNRKRISDMSISRIFVSTIVITFAVASLANAQEPATTKPEPALDVTSMDRTVDPCVDFFQYSCGGWIKSNPIPPDQSSWDTYSKMQEENRERLRGILEAASKPNSSRDASEQKIGDYYASCMDETAINGKGTAPLEPQLDRIAQLASKAEIAD